MDHSADEMLHSDGIVDVSVVIAAHNAELTLGDQLEALSGQTWDRAWEVVVVDNGSTDSTARLVHACSTRNPRVPCTAKLLSSTPPSSRAPIAHEHDA